MSKTIRVIQSCNHMTRSESLEYKEAKVYRQEKRDRVRNTSTSSKFMYYGEWTQETNNGIVYSINSASTDRCSIFFYGDDITLYGLKHPDGGDISVYLDGSKVSTVNTQGELTQTYTIIRAVELDYGPHIIEIGVGDFDPAQPWYPASTSEIRTSAVVKFPVYYAEFTELLVDYKQDYDIIVENEVLAGIEKVYQLDLNTEEYTEFKQEVDYIFLPSNKIQWISINRPKSGISYYVKYKKKVVKYNTTSAELCEKCGGYGWYASLQDLNSLAPSRSTGMQKIAEDIIKIILSPYNDETGYGSKFKSLLQDLHFDADNIETYGATEIGRIADWYKENQNNEKTLGAEFENEDLLSELYISDIHYNSTTGALYISVLIKNEDGEYAQEILEV